MGINRETSCRKILAVEGLANPSVLSKGKEDGGFSMTTSTTPVTKTTEDGDGWGLT